jgi:hypothetical protein
MGVMPKMAMMAASLGMNQAPAQMPYTDMANANQQNKPEKQEKTKRRPRRRPRRRRLSSSRRIRRITVKVTRISSRNVIRKTVERQTR